MKTNQHILIINSCSKSKKKTDPSQPLCESLRTPRDRKRQISLFSKKLTNAGELYTGKQALAVKKAVQLLRHNNIVDYYIISAGFGLVSETTQLPPYECSFSGKSTKIIREMSSYLGIQDDVKALFSNQDYDMVYLALGKDYLTALGNIDYMGRKSAQVVIFNEKYENKENFIVIRDSQLVNLGVSVLNKAFQHSIGALITSKGSILLNYAMYLSQQQKENMETLLFKDWFNQKLSLIKQIIDKSDSINRKNERTSIHIFNQESENAGKKSKIQSYHKNIYKASDNKGSYTTSEVYDLSVKPETQKMVKLASKKVTNNDLKKLVDACKGLKSINNKKGESRKDYVDRYKEHLNLFRVIVETGNKAIKEANEKTGDAKTKIKAEYVKNLRSRQEQLRLSGSLLNEVKYGFMTSMIKWLDNPEELKKKGVYRPRGDKVRKSKRIQEPDIDLKLKNNKEKDGKWMLTFEISNIENVGLQNVTFSFLNKKNKKMEILSVSGQSMEYNEENKLVHVPYIQASMEPGKKYTTKMKIVADRNEDFDDPFSVEVQQDFPLQNERVSKTFEF